MLETFIELLAILWVSCSFSIMILMIIDWKNYKKEVLDTIVKSGTGQKARAMFITALIIFITAAFAPVFMAGALAVNLKRK